MPCHQQSGSAFSAADVCHPCSRLEFLFHIAQGGNPCADQIGGIAGTEELLASMKDAVSMLMPTHTGTCTKRFNNTWNRRK